MPKIDILFLRVVLLAALAALAGCRQPDAAVPAADVAAVATTEAPVADAVAIAPGHYVLAFTAPAEVEADPRILHWTDDDCGQAAFAAVDAMPIDDPVLRPDYVVEFGPDGQVLRRWAKPYAAEILGIAGERLHFLASHDGRDREFWTQPDGTLGLLEDALSDPGKSRRAFSEGAVAIDCPALDAFAGTGAVQCYEITDAGGQRRRVAFEGACS